MIYIGIVSRVEKDDEGYTITGIGEYYRNALSKYDNVIPVMILPPKDILYGQNSYSDECNQKINDNKKLDPLLDLCDGFIIPGGSHWYSYDEYVINYALEKDKPILGICLGMQIMGVMDNRKNNGLYDTTHLINEKNTHKQIDKKYAHEITINKDSKLYEILGVDKCEVNSRHCYEIEDVVNFKTVAFSDDGVIEAIEYPNKTFAIGVQWHPELMIGYDDIMKRLFDSFIEKSKETKKQKVLTI